jgi:hypothetical protein
MTKIQEPARTPGAQESSRVFQQEQMTLMSLVGGAGSRSNGPLFPPSPSGTAPRSIAAILEEALLILEDFDFPCESLSFPYERQSVERRQ